MQVKNTLIEELHKNLLDSKYVYPSSTIMDADFGLGALCPKSLVRGQNFELYLPKESMIGYEGRSVRIFETDGQFGIYNHECVNPPREGPLLYEMKMFDNEQKLYLHLDFWARDCKDGWADACDHLR